jgi:hypothetical protein
VANLGVRNVFVAALGAGLIASCASPPRQESTSLPGTDACFWIANVSDWTVLDNSTLLLSAPLAEDAYLVKLFAPIPDLKWRLRLGFEGGDGVPEQFCRDSGYVLAYGPVPQRELAVSVRALTPAQARQLVARAGDPAPHAVPPS